jgi:hypothetical protein
MADEAHHAAPAAADAPSLAELHRELDELTDQIDQARHKVDADHRHGPSPAEGWSTASHET